MLLQDTHVHTALWVSLLYLNTAWVQHYITCHLADSFIQSDLQLIRLSRRHSPLEQCGAKGLAQGPNSCADLIMATPGIEPPTLRVQVKYLNHYATGCPSLQQSSYSRMACLCNCRTQCVIIVRLRATCISWWTQKSNTGHKHVSAGRIRTK